MPVARHRRRSTRRPPRASYSRWGEPDGDEFGELDQEIDELEALLATLDARPPPPPARGGTGEFVVMPLAPGRTAINGDLATLFGIDMLGPAGPPAPAPAAAPRPSEQREVGREYLRVLGIPARVIAAWIREGVLQATDRRDVYVRTDEANRRIAGYLER
jgi:hypothetical protein